MEKKYKFILLFTYSIFASFLILLFLLITISQAQVINENKTIESFYNAVNCDIGCQKYAYTLNNVSGGNFGDSQYLGSDYISCSDYCFERFTGGDIFGK